MNDFHQGDIIKINGYKNYFLIISNNAFIKATSVFHVSPIISNIQSGPLHIVINGTQKTTGTVVCEQIKLIDPDARSCVKTDNIPYNEIMNISDALQGIFEYD